MLGRASDRWVSPLALEPGLESALQVLVGLVRAWMQWWVPVKVWMQARVTVSAWYPGEMAALKSLVSVLVLLFQDDPSAAESCFPDLVVL